jgi:alpha-L-fucosidase
MPNGEIQPEFIQRLHWMGNWLRTYGPAIYHTTGGYLRPQKWGCLTRNGDKLYVHVLQTGPVRLEKFPYTSIKKAYRLKDRMPVEVSLRDGIAEIPAQTPTPEDPDQVVVLEIATNPNPKLSNSN